MRLGIIHMIHVDDAMEPSLKIFSSVVPGTS